jgi:hypothetical protein
MIDWILTTFGHANFGQVMFYEQPEALQHDFDIRYPVSLEVVDVEEEITAKIKAGVSLIYEE